MLFQRDAITHLTDKGHAGVIDEDIERLHFLDSSLNLLLVGDVQCQRRNTPIGMGQGLPRTGIHPLRASSQSFLDQRSANAAIGTGNQNCLVCDDHYFLLSSVMSQKSRTVSYPATRVRPESGASSAAESR